MLACSSQFYEPFVGLHEAIFNQKSIYFKGLIEPAYAYLHLKVENLFYAGFMTQQGQALRVIAYALL